MIAPIRCVAVGGARAMGAGIAEVAAQAGASVVFFDSSSPTLEIGKARVETSLSAQVQRAKLSREDAEAVAGRIAWPDDLSAAAGVDLLIEAIVETADIKSDLFAKVEAVVADDAIIASNTSSLPISSLASGLKHPCRFLGMHFFNPAPAIKLVEVVAGSFSDPAAAEAVRSTAAAWGNGRQFDRIVLAHRFGRKIPAQRSAAQRGATARANVRAMPNRATEPLAQSRLCPS